MVQEQSQTQEALAHTQWRNDPQTQIFFKFLADKLQQCKDDWVSRKFGSTTDSNLTLQLNAEALGSAAMLDDLIKLTYEDIAKFYDDQRQQYERYSREGQQSFSSAKRTGGY